MPSTAMTVLQAKQDGLRNFSLFSNHITIIPAIKAILDSPDLQLDGFLGPSHVSMVIGVSPYDFIARQYRKPMTIAGLEPLDNCPWAWRENSRQKTKLVIRLTLGFLCIMCWKILAVIHSRVYPNQKILAPSIEENFSSSVGLIMRSA